MRLAGDKLSAAENRAYADQQRVLRKGGSYKSAIYASGTEYVLVQSLAQLMSALVGVLNESVTEGLRAFYKLRKAYMALDNIMRMEDDYFERNARSGVPKKSMSVPPSPRASSPAVEDKNTAKAAEASDLDLSEEPVSKVSEQIFSMKLACDRDASVFTNPMDLFIHTGANLCFGMLLIFISMTPPTYSKILYIIGFRGDRERGLQMLWQASKFDNLCGGLAGLMLLVYYNGMIRMCDVIPDRDPRDDGANLTSYPSQPLHELLRTMRARFSRSQLWQLEESRMAALDRRLSDALKVLSSGQPSPLKQVRALHAFEKSLDAMFAHEYELCAVTFLECVELNSWSQALYVYVAASCYICLYRQTSDPTVKQQAAERAGELFKQVPTYAGRKKFFARQLPFDVFVLRKVTKYEARAAALGVSLVDAVGVDPVEEMIFLYSGHVRMNGAELAASLENLAWVERELPWWPTVEADEKAQLALLRSAILREQGQHDAAIELLSTKVVNLDRAAFRGGNRENYVLPAGHYEMGVNYWCQRTGYRPVKPLEGGGVAGETNVKVDDPVAHDASKVATAREWIERVARWESYELDARFGLRITMAQTTTQQWEEQNKQWQEQQRKEREERTKQQQQRAAQPEEQADSAN